MIKRKWENLRLTGAAQSELPDFVSTSSMSESLMGGKDWRDRRRQQVQGKTDFSFTASSENRNILTWIVKNKCISSCWIHLLPPSRCVCRLLCWRCANNKKSPWRREVQFLVLLVVWFWSRIAGLRPPPLPPGQGPEDAPGTGTSGSNRGNGSGVNKCYGGLKFKNIGRNLTFTQTDSFGFSGKCVSSFSCSSVDSK